MNFINLTPHIVTIIISGDKTEITSTGVARVSTYDTELEPVGGVPVVSSPVIGPIEGLPDAQDGTAYIVSLMVLQHPDVVGRRDVFAPATGPKHAAVRDEQGRIVGVTRLVAAPRSPKLDNTL